MRSSSVVISVPLALNTPDRATWFAGHRSFCCVPQVSQPRREVAVGPERSRLDRADRHAETLGDLGLGEVLDVLQANALALVRRKRVDRLPDRPNVEGLLDAGRQLHH